MRGVGETTGVGGGGGCPLDSGQGASPRTRCPPGGALTRTGGVGSLRGAAEPWRRPTASARRWTTRTHRNGRSFAEDGDT